MEAGKLFIRVYVTNSNKFCVHSFSATIAVHVANVTNRTLAFNFSFCCFSSDFFGSFQKYYGLFQSKVFFSESPFHNLSKEVWLSSEL